MATMPIFFDIAGKKAVIVGGAGDEETVKKMLAFTVSEEGLGAVEMRTKAFAADFVTSNSIYPDGGLAAAS